MTTTATFNQRAYVNHRRIAGEHGLDNVIHRWIPGDTWHCLGCIVARIPGFLDTLADIRKDQEGVIA
jgi:hypothetical protein